ncbi:hypothetical protein LGQ04_13500 [Cellulosimicrobium marinum]|nr:hypothetical protein [Cellulosimicrobium marinum]
MIRSGTRDEPVDPERDALDRRRWLAQVADVRVHGTCGCGSCPTVDLGDATGPAPTGGPRVVLGAELDDALVLLFVDDDRPSCLELAPLDDATYPEFPPVADLRT